MASATSSNSGATTHPSGGKSPNELNLYDMSGNVSEWCWDVWGVSPRIHRGGGWGGSDVFCAVDYRNGSDPGLGDVSIGFRVVRP